MEYSQALSKNFVDTGCNLMLASAAIGLVGFGSLAAGVVLNNTGRYDTSFKIGTVGTFVSAVALGRHFQF